MAVAAKPVGLPGGPALGIARTVMINDLPPGSADQLPPLSMSKESAMLQPSSVSSSLSDAMALKVGSSPTLTGLTSKA